MQNLARRAGQGTMILATAWLLFQLALAAWLFARHDWAVVTFPYPVDYGEGPLLDQALRLARLENIYRTSLDAPPYTISNYPPLFPLLQVPFAAALGPALWYGRAIAALSMLAAALFVALSLHTLTKDLVASAAGGLLVLAFPYTLHWSAFNRVDSLALGLSCAALFAVARWPHRRAGLVTTALLLTAAIFTRQSYALAAPLAAFVWLLREPPRRRAFALVALTGGACLALLLALQLATGGGFFFNVVTANVNPFVWANLRYRLEELRDHLLPLLAAAGLFALLGAWYAGRHALGPGGWRSSPTPRAAGAPPAWWLVAPYLVGAALSALTIGKTGSNVNYLFELCAALSLAAGALLAWAGRRPWLRAALALGLALQVGAMAAWSRADYAPRALGKVAQRAEIERLLAVVEGAGGPVLADEYMGLIPLAGQRLYFQPFELKQLAEAGVWDERPFTRQLDAREFPAILIYDPPDWNSFDERWTGRQQLYILTGYAPAERYADTIVYRPAR
ncbi:MAG TPA: hypothetical protein VNL77_01105 [Roseiflexaceae bacterium]|nr:hypothetical protein [Roseiflexaceae bacterium]